MSTQSNRADPSRAPGAPAQKRRFRVEKLEERIAPAKGGKRPTYDCTTGSGASSSPSDGSATTIY